MRSIIQHRLVGRLLLRSGLRHPSRLCIVRTRNKNPLRPMPTHHHSHHASITSAQSPLVFSTSSRRLGPFRRHLTPFHPNGRLMALRSPSNARAARQRETRRARFVPTAISARIPTSSANAAPPNDSISPKRRATHRLTDCQCLVVALLCLLVAGVVQ